ncbi:unnamed protein product [Meganyctiphanes norvegica]|uniref:Uncharacterized protein n=1 Tax=Meganyctiphanes norvegica TaxID=48144 RepID=A0AAV2QG59_MEGNR
MNIVTVVFSYLHTMANKGDVVYWSEDPGWWYKDRNRWDYHILATSSEWFLAGALCTYILTLIPEFKRIRVKRPIVELDRDRKQSRTLSQQKYDSDSAIVDIRL